MTSTAISVTLESAIEQQLNLGVKDPHIVYDKLRLAMGNDEIVALAAPYVPDMIAYMARQKLNAQRRQAVVKINKSTLAEREVMLKALWVPQEDGYTYKKIADMTAEDFDARASYLERMTQAITQHALWCRGVAGAIRQGGHLVAGQLSTLPGLPELEAA